MDIIDDKIGKRRQPIFMPVVNHTAPEFLQTYPSLLADYHSNPVKISFDRKDQLILFESGGFTSNPPKDPIECLKHQLSFVPDAVLTLDYPIKKYPDASQQEKEKMMADTIHNVEWAVTNADYYRKEYGNNYTVVGVIQGETYYEIRGVTHKLCDIGCNYLALGSIPTNERGKVIKKRCISLCRDIREIIEDRYLHLLGVMDISIIKEVKDYITSFDATSLQKLAVYGKVYGEGLDDYLIKKNLENYEKALDENVYN